MKATLILIFLCMTMVSFGQEELHDETYYTTVPAAPQTYTPGAIVSRMIDGLGFRYYWATQGLVETDLAYKPSEGARSLEETIDHIYSLSTTIVNSAKQEPNDKRISEPVRTTAQKRTATLENFRVASGLFLATTDIAKHTIIIVKENGQDEYPFWNQINGPIEDAIWHAGQLVVLRRAAGNPIDNKVNFFRGTRNE